MGVRANYVLISGGETQIFYESTGGLHIPDIFLWGYTETLAWLNCCREEDCLMDDIWCEAGAVMNTNQHTLSIWAGMDFSINLRWLWLNLAVTAWKDWNIVWCQNGLIDLASAVGATNDLLLQSDNFDELKKMRPPEVLHPGYSFPCAVLVSIKRQSDRWEDYWLCRRKVESLLVGGVKVIDLLSEIPTVDLDAIRGKGLDYTFDGCISIDTAEKRISHSSIWSLSYHPQLCDWLESKWPGWQIEKHHLGIPEHLLRTDRNPFDWMPLQDQAEQLANLLFESKPDNGKRTRFFTLMAERYPTNS